MSKCSNNRVHNFFDLLNFNTFLSIKLSRASKLNLTRIFPSIFAFLFVYNSSLFCSISYYYYYYFKGISTPAESSLSTFLFHSQLFFSPLPRRLIGVVVGDCVLLANRTIQPPLCLRSLPFSRSVAVPLPLPVVVDRRYHSSCLRSRPCRERGEAPPVLLGPVSAQDKLLLLRCMRAGCGQAFAYRSIPTRHPCVRAISIFYLEDLSIISGALNFSVRQSALPFISFTLPLSWATHKPLRYLE